MFSREDIAGMESIKSRYIILQMNHHDITIHSLTTGHDWIVVSNYETSDCYILHRHSRRDPYHRQRGRYKSLREALEYIISHDEWFVS